MEYLCKWDNLGGAKIHNTTQRRIYKWNSYVSGTLDTAHRVTQLSSPHCYFQESWTMNQFSFHHRRCRMKIQQILVNHKKFRRWRSQILWGKLFTKTLSSTGFSKICQQWKVKQATKGRVEDLIRRKGSSYCCTLLGAWKSSQQATPNMFLKQRPQKIQLELSFDPCNCSIHTYIQACRIHTWVCNPSASLPVIFQISICLVILDQ